MDSKIWHKWTYIWNRNRIRDIENRLVTAQGEGIGGRMEWSVGLTDTRFHIYRTDKQQSPTAERRDLYSVCVYATSLQLCLTLCDPMECSQKGSSAHGSLQARILEWVATPCTRGSSRPRDWTHISYVSCTGRQVLHCQRHLGSPYIQYPTLTTIEKNVLKKNGYVWITESLCCPVEINTALYINFN